VKPANLFLVERGEEPAVVKVLDFGISKIMDDGDWSEQAALTKTTAVLGSGLYMSPEQMRSAKNVDRRTDVYALGVCLYELLTHTQPYTADSFAELCVKVSTEPPEPLRKYRPDVSEELAAVIAHAYAAKPDDRFQSIADFAEALGPYALPHSQATLEAIAFIGDRKTSPSLAPPPPAAAPSDTGAVRVGPGHTTAASGALARTAAVDAPKKSPVGLVVVGAGMLLATIATVFALGVFGIGLSPFKTGETAEVAPATTTADTTAGATEDTATTAEPETTTASDTGAQAAEEDAGAGGAAPEAAAAASATATAVAPPVPRPRPRPKPAPKIIKEGPLCFRINPATKVREIVDCP